MVATDEMDDLEFALSEGYGLDLAKCNGGKGDDGTYYPAIFEIGGNRYILRPFTQDGIDKLAKAIAALDNNRLGMYEPFNPNVEGSGWFGAKDVPENWEQQIREILNQAGDKVYVMSLGREPFPPSITRRAENLSWSECKRLDREFKKNLPRFLKGLSILD